MSRQKICKKKLLTSRINFLEKKKKRNSKKNYFLQISYIKFKFKIKLQENK